MNWLGHFLIGFMIGGGVGVILMTILFAGSKADNELLGDRQYEE